MFQSTGQTDVMSKVEAILVLFCEWLEDNYSDYCASYYGAFSYVFGSIDQSCYTYDQDDDRLYFKLDEADKYLTPFINEFCDYLVKNYGSDTGIKYPDVPDNSSMISYTGTIEAESEDPTEVEYDPLAIIDRDIMKLPSPLFDSVFDIEKFTSQFMSQFIENNGSGGSGGGTSPKAPGADK